MRRARVIWRLVVMNLVMTMEYRGAMFVYIISNVTGPLISLLVWLAVSDQGVQLPYDRSQFVTYYLLLSLVSMLTASWLAPFVAEQIRLGGISPWLLRPAPYIVHDIANNIGEKLIKLPLLLPLIGLFGLAFHGDVHLPTAPGAWLLFALCLPLAATVAFLLDFVVGSLAFWMQDVRGLVRVKELVGAFLAGQFVPLALFPHALNGALEAQPFRYTISFPVEVLTGTLSATALARGFAWQLGYCLGLWACYRLLWHYGLRGYTASGA